MTIQATAWVAYGLPLAGCVLIALLGNALPRRLAGIIASGAMLGAFAFSVVVFLRLRGRTADARSIHSTLWTWLSAGSFKVNMDILVDPLSAVMLLIVTGVGFLIHVYSVGYMHGDVEERRYFAYLNLFVFSMLILVLAGNFVLLLAGWGMVGLSSYLLIGFWHQKASAVAAAKKAFVMNAVGDVGLAIGIFMIFKQLGTVDYLTVFERHNELGFGSSTINGICLMLLVGGLAKSAQLPLHTWLPDAMEGPTPVSALIHAATMVTAGVYLIARMNPLYSYAPDVQHLIVVIGVAGLLMAGLTALTQTDIKRVIAFSTMSQIAYMFVGVGLGAYWTGIYHLTTHAFFKALLFMGAGVVIHALSGEQDIRKMGGLKRWLPRTYVCMWIGTLALAGFPLISSAASKDSILAAGLEVGGTWGTLAFVGGVAGALLTGIYASRLMYVVFHGPTADQAAHDAEHHTAHGEGPATMTLPVYILAALTLVAGFLQFPSLTTGMSTWLEPTTYGTVQMVEAGTSNEWIATAAGSIAGILGILIATVLWRAGRSAPVAFPRPLAILSERRFFWDELYHYALFVPTAWLANLLRGSLERYVFLAAPDAVGSLAGVASRRLSVLQTGIVRIYALAFAVGVAGLVLYFMVQAA